MMSRGLLLLHATLVSSIACLCACNKDGADPTTTLDSDSSPNTSQVGTTTGSAPTTSEVPGTEDGDPPTTTMVDPTVPPPDHGGSGGQCNLFLQDCNEGEKCTAYATMGGLFPDGTKCVPETGDKLPGEPCALDGDFGEGADDCVAGSLCLDIDNSGKATCVAYCGGDMETPTCANDEKCAFLFEPTVPLCFPPCNPLVQDCPDSDACVPNIAALGSEYFVCMPLVFEAIPGQYGDACYAISGCDKGFQCIFALNVPNCKGDMYCCSSWCDLSAPDSCKQFDQTIDCVPWYEEGGETPGYENVGICGIMP